MSITNELGLKQLTDQLHKSSQYNIDMLYMFKKKNSFLTFLHVSLMNVTMSEAEDPEGK